MIRCFPGSEDQLVIHAPHRPEGLRLRQPDDRGLENHVVERFGEAGVPKENITLITKDMYRVVSSAQSPPGRPVLHQRSLE
jgi:hypothetical protein